MKTTLNKLSGLNACRPIELAGLMVTIGKTAPDDDPIEIDKIIDILGIQAALHALETVEGRDKELRLFLVWLARTHGEHIVDARSMRAIKAAERYANGEISEDELERARREASAACQEARKKWYPVRHSPGNAAKENDASADAHSCAYADIKIAIRTAYMGASPVEHGCPQEIELRRICEACRQA